MNALRVAAAAVAIFLTAADPESGSVATGSLSRGRHLANAVLGCTHCHGADLSGNVAIDDPQVVVLWAPNLTRGKGGFFATHGAGDFARAVRHGYAPGGKKLLFMPSWNYAALSQSDYASVLAFVLSTPPVDKQSPPAKFGPKARAALASGELGYDADELAKAPVPAFDTTPDATPAYGKYLARVAGCQSCHGANLAGTPGFAPNLTPRAIGNWSASDFITTIKTGVTPGNRKLSDEMPWRVYAHMSNEELHALYAYLHSLPPR